MTVSPNSLAALDAITRDGSRQLRHEEIATALEKLGYAIPREIAAELGYEDPNCVRPRLTEGTGTRYETCGKKLDPATGHWATVYRLKKQEPAKPFCNCTFAGHLKSVESKKHRGMVAVFCVNPVHGKPILYGYSHDAS